MKLIVIFEYKYYHILIQINERELIIILFIWSI